MNSSIDNYNRHWKNLNAQLTNSTIGKNYKEAQSTYESMRKDFMRKLQQTKRDEVSENQIKQFKLMVNNQYRAIDAPLAEQKINDGFKDLTELIENNENIQLMIDHVIKEDLITILDAKASQKARKNASDKTIKQKKRRKLTKQHNWEHITDDYLDNQINKLIEKHPIFASEINKMLKNSSLQEPKGYDASDVLSHCIMPIINKKTRDILDICKKDIKMDSSKGYFYEAAVAKAFSEMLQDKLNPKVAVIHMGKENKSADIVVDFSEALNIVDEEEKKKNQHGIQVKNYDFKDFDNLKPDMLGFQRISNKAKLLEQFQNKYRGYFTKKTTEKNKEYTALIDKNNQDSYTKLQSLAMLFLSEEKRLYNILGENNVAYVGKTGLQWTTALLKTWINHKRWLCFQSGLGKEFTAQIGIL